MKKSGNSLYLVSGAFILHLVGACILGACETNEPVVFNGPHHVRFTESSGEIVENYFAPNGENLNEPASVSLHLVSPHLENDTEIEYKILGDAKEGEDFELLGENPKSVVIPAGESFGNITFKTLNNRDRDGDRKIRFSITNVNNGLNIGRGGRGLLGKTFVYTIEDDDCLVDLRKFEGTWEVEETFGEEDEQSLSYELDIRPDFDYNNRIEISGFAGLDSLGARAFANLDLCSGELIIPEQVLGGVDGELGNVRSVGSGTFNADEGTINFTYKLDDFGNNEWSVSASKQ